jgi:hypothetical protein
MLSEQELLTLIAITLIVSLLYKRYKKIQYRTAMQKPFPEQWQHLLATKLPLYLKLPDFLRHELQQKIKHFLYYKTFIGCAGLEINDEIRVIIAAEACLLILNRPTSCYASLKWIYVYPSVFIAKRKVANEYGIVAQTRTALLGESWQNGRLILAWDNVESGMKNFHDGHNVVLHEFAHQLDQESGQANGAPLLYTKDSYQIWSRVFSDEFTRLQKALTQGKRTLIDQYGATNPAEFFAVVTEVFFEKPHALHKSHPQLFSLLSDYYRLDPRDWL